MHICNYSMYEGLPTSCYCTQPAPPMHLWHKASLVWWKHSHLCLQLSPHTVRLFLALIFRGVAGYKYLVGSPDSSLPLASALPSTVSVTGDQPNPTSTIYTMMMLQDLIFVTYHQKIIRLCLSATPAFSLTQCVTWRHRVTPQPKERGACSEMAGGNPYTQSFNVEIIVILLFTAINQNFDYSIIIAIPLWLLLLISYTQLRN